MGFDAFHNALDDETADPHSDFIPDLDRRIRHDSRIDLAALRYVEGAFGVE
jgi:hypothetical protein